MELLKWETLAVVLPALAALLVLSRWVIKTVVPWLRKRTEKMFGVTHLKAVIETHAAQEKEEHVVINDNLKNLNKFLEATTKKVDKITQEFQPNSGETIRDALNRIEANVDLTGERQRARMLDTEELLFETDCMGNVVWVNRTLSRKTRRLPGELLGNGWVNVVHPEDREDLVTEWHSAIEETRECETTTRLVSTEGEVMSVSCKGYLMHDIKGNSLGWLVSFTELKNATNSSAD